MNGVLLAGRRAGRPSDTTRRIRTSASGFEGLKGATSPLPAPSSAAASRTSTLGTSTQTSAVSRSLSWPTTGRRSAQGAEQPQAIIGQPPAPLRREVPALPGGLEQDGPRRFSQLPRPRLGRERPKHGWEDDFPGGGGTRFGVIGKKPTPP